MPLSTVVAHIVSADVTPEKLGAIAILGLVAAYRARAAGSRFWVVCGAITVLVVVTGGLGLATRMYG